VIPRRRKQPKMGVREETRFRSEPYKQWIRGFPCSVADKPSAQRVIKCHGGIEAAHVQADDRVPYEERSAGSIKAGDNWTYPLCVHHHHAAHSMGHSKFDAMFGIDRVKIALSLWNHPGNRHRIKWEQRKERSNG